MIGEIRFTLGSQKVLAVLTDALTWTCNEKKLEEYLNDICPPGACADRRSAIHLLYQAGERLGGEVHLMRVMPALH